jgi:CRP/FNR family transcriptional regulator, cyclic AMP receptor protein
MVTPQLECPARPITVNQVTFQQSAEQRLDFFTYLTPEAQRDFESAASRRQVPAREHIYRQNDRHQRIFRIVSGRVWLTSSRPDGREHLSLFAGPGECFGFSSLIDGEGLPQSAIARSEVTLQMLSKTALAALRAKHRSIDDALMRSMQRDIRILIRQLSAASISDLRSRLAHRLLVYSLPRSPDQLVVRLTQTELAGVFGVSRQTVNKLLRDFERDGLIKRAYGEVELRDVDRLRQLADGI